MSCRVISSVGIAFLVLLLAGPSPVLAGPPLLCHPFDIGTAPSLPWDGTRSWYQGRADYIVANLVADTEALLTPAMPIIVRMETLRRAAIYASQNRPVAEQLLARVLNRATSARKGTDADALAHLDAAYVVEAFKQLRSLAASNEREFRDRGETLRALNLTADGYSLIQASLAARPDDPALEFAAALIASDKDRAAYQQHAQKARAGANRDALVTRNLKHIL